MMKWVCLKKYLAILFGFTSLVQVFYYFGDPCQFKELQFILPYIKDASERIVMLFNPTGIPPPLNSTKHSYDTGLV